MKAYVNSFDPGNRHFLLNEFARLLGTEHPPQEDIETLRQCLRSRYEDWRPEIIEAAITDARSKSDAKNKSIGTGVVTWLVLSTLFAGIPGISEGFHGALFFVSIAVGVIAIIASRKYWENTQEKQFLSEFEKSEAELIQRVLPGTSPARV